MASTTYLQQAYLAYFGRPADVSGLSFYADKTEASVVAAFSASAESQAFFGSLNTLAQINTIYQNLFNRAAEPAGLTYWAGEINAGRLSLAQASMGILAGAQNDDKLAVTNKLAAATAFTAALDTSAEMIGYQGSSVITSARAYLASVGSTAASLTAATATTALNASVATVVAAGVSGASSAAAGATFTLTTNLDSATNQTSVSATLSDTAAERTWGLTDTVSGTSATTDTLSTRIIGDANGTSYSGLTTSAIENVNVTYTDGADAADANSMAMGGFSGLTNIIVKDSTIINTTAAVDDSMSFTSVAAGVALQVSNNAAKLNVNYTGVGTATSGDSVTLNTAGGSTGDVTFADAAGDGFVTVNVVTSSATSTLQALAAGTDFTTLTVTGTAGLTVSDSLATTVTSVDASGNSGAVTLSATGASTLTAKGGSGTADVMTLAFGGSVSTGMAISGFETVRLQATATASVTGSLITGATTTRARASTTDISAVVLTLNEFASGTGINIVGTGTDAAQFSNAVTLVQTGASTGTADSVAITMSNGGVAVATTNTLTAGLITAANIETVTLAVSDFGNVNGSLTIANAKTLTLTGSAILDLATFTGSSALATIDAGAYTGKLTIGALTSVTGDLTFTGSTGVDIVTNAAVATAKTQTLNLGAGADQFTLSAALAAADSVLTVNAGAGDDTITWNEDASSTGVWTINGGDGTDTLIAGGLINADALTATISGIEKIDLRPNAGAATLNLTVATGYAETVTITEVSGTTTTINLNVAAGGTVSGANLSLIGYADGTDVLNYNSTASGNESFTFGALNGGAALTETYTVVATNGIDTITGFGAGANEDIVNATALSAFLNTTTEAVLNVTATDTAGAANDNILLLNAGVYYANAAAVVAATSAQTFGSGIAAATAHALIAYQTAAGSAVRIAEATLANAGGITAATDLVVLTGVTTITNLVASNFVID